MREVDARIVTCDINTMEAISMTNASHVKMLRQGILQGLDNIQLRA